MLCNKSLHEIRGPGDRDKNGGCSACRREYQKQRNAKYREAYRAMQARGKD